VFYLKFKAHKAYAKCLGRIRHVLPKFKAYTECLRRTLKVLRGTLSVLPKI
jgi:hypothetical protein